MESIYQTLAITIYKLDERIKELKDCNDERLNLKSKIETIKANVNNEKLSDSEFRKFINTFNF